MKRHDTFGRRSPRLGAGCWCWRLGMPAPLHAQPPAARRRPPPVPGPDRGPAVQERPGPERRPGRATPLAMQYITASLGVGCDFCHVTGPGGAFDKDDKEPKQQRPRHDEDDGGHQHRAVRRPSDRRLHVVPQRPDAADAHPRPGGGDDARGSAAARAGRGGRGGSVPVGPAAPVDPAVPAGRAARPVQRPAVRARRRARRAAGRTGRRATAGRRPCTGGAAAQGRGGRGGQPPPPPSETLDQVIAKYQQALGGKDALAKATTRVLTGSVTTRDLQTSNVTVKETATGALSDRHRRQPTPTVRVVNGKTGWSSGGFNNQVRDLEGLQYQQAARLADFGLPLHLTDRYESLSVSRYGNVDGKPTILVTGRPFPRRDRAAAVRPRVGAAAAAIDHRPRRRSVRCRSRSTTATIAT